MLLKPHEILKHLGFDVPEEGVYINPNDAYMHATALRLMGKTMDAESIPSADLEQMHTGLAGLVAMWRKEDPVQITENSVLKLRLTVEVIMSHTFKYQND